MWNLDRYQAGCPTAFGIIIGVSIGAFILLCIIGCVVIIICGINWRKYLCCCCESQRNRHATDTNQAVSYGAQIQTTTYAVPDIEKPAHDDGQLMYQAAPPSYEDLVHATKMEEQCDTTSNQEPGTAQSQA